MDRIVTRWGLGLALGAAMLASLLGGSARAIAQVGMPGTEAVTPDPSLCRVDGRTVDGLRAIFAAATPAATDDVSPSIVVPVGRPADATTAAGIVATVHEAVACLNAGDLLRFLGLLTDGAIVSAFPWLADQLAGADVPAELQTPFAVPVDQRQTLLAVAGVSRLADGRVSAVIATVDPASDAPGADALFLIFTLRGDRWLIDEIIDFSGD
ncbi:MAG: hypothetical protein QOJ59_1654 [Thermomicrobiales bacterium]|jgi:hypothetical protein|nr:hypothetical protein [Thermomicrobiales bacterium]